MAAAAEAAAGATERRRRRKQRGGGGQHNGGVRSALAAVEAPRQGVEFAMAVFLRFFYLFFRDEAGKIRSDLKNCNYRISRGISNTGA